MGRGEAGSKSENCFLRPHLPVWWKTRVRGYADMRVCGYAGMRICGYADMRVCGYAGMRICGYAGMRVCGYADMRVRRTGLTNRFYYYFIII